MAVEARRGPVEVEKGGLVSAAVLGAAILIVLGFVWSVGVDRLMAWRVGSGRGDEKPDDVVERARKAGL